MHTNMRFTLLSFVLLVLCVSASSARQDRVVYHAEMEAAFGDGMKAFEAGDYEKALALYMQAIREYPTGHRITGAYVMAGKAQYRLGNFRESIRLLKHLVDSFPGSLYVGDAFYTLGLNYLRTARYDDAAMAFLLVRQQSGDPEVRNRSEELLGGTVLAYLSIAELQILLGEVRSDEMRVMISMRLSERLYRSGEIQEARSLLRSLTGLPPRTKHLDEAKRLLERMETGDVVRVGVILPLMLHVDNPAAKELGAQVLSGVKLAVDEYNKTNFPRVELDVRDSERDPGKAAREVTELCMDASIAAIVGPFFSAETFTAAGIANALGVPIVSPTATSNGIANVGSFVYQLNPDYDVRGRAMARYAFQTLGSRTFAVLAPVSGSPANKAMADAFVDEVSQLGGEVVDQQWYPAGATDLRSQLMMMRQKAMERLEDYYIDFAKKLTNNHLIGMLKWGVPPRLLDSLVEREATVSVRRLFGFDGKRVADSLKIPVHRVDANIDSLGLPVKTIDAIFLPISNADEIGIVSSQLRYFNFQTQYLGTGDWYDLGELEYNRQYVEGVVFSSDYYIDEESETYKSLFRRYQRDFGSTLIPHTLFSYDAMRFVLQGIGSGAGTRPSLAAAMASQRRFTGVHSIITLGEKRVNSYLTILQYKNRTIRKIGEVDLAGGNPSQ
ncbi:MAG: tetratricopeptide repeat protein [Ignavibacteria bacterium]|nr:tetratricopeptide repeat protein [Ignavibacteria bacterium]